MKGFDTTRGSSEKLRTPKESKGTCNLQPNPRGSLGAIMEESSNLLTTHDKHASKDEAFISDIITGDKAFSTKLKTNDS